ncbi:ribosomal protein S18-alanine N-acetyltransferase [Geodermatophilus sp. YIM 151500]|uniref:ribosomal protein S18-alanine N-acetyltransferase n=1 Tax=Geodermatophilus sp. YIM 151500 TaxID=2984531 RepID=UPI0021E3FD47|nr:ribosomal protein S18-alanine N-acetyltransferase [Geodermatophilus sp. YIM 151500]MCV2488454.1 ribosomal protein S18-alanine N-acetyltransferase [Geodermatophilus sp. YIM 151500]
MSVRLRTMTVDDLPAVLPLEEDLFAPDTWSAAMYRDELVRTDTRHYLVAENGTGVVGWAGLIAYDDEAHVSTIGVARDRQGEGIGARLLDALLAEADRRSPVVLLEVRADNDVALEMYRRRGFTEIGRRPRYYQPSGTDAVVMKRERGPRVDGDLPAGAGEGTG